MSRRDWSRNETARRNEHDPLQHPAAYVAERKPTSIAQRSLIRKLRVELGIHSDVMPTLSRDASKLIDELLTRKRHA